MTKGKAAVRVQDGMVLIDAGDGRELSVDLSRRDQSRLKPEAIEAKR